MLSHQRRRVRSHRQAGDRLVPDVVGREHRAVRRARQEAAARGGGRGGGEDKRQRHGQRTRRRAIDTRLIPPIFDAHRTSGLNPLGAPSPAVRSPLRGGNGRNAGPPPRVKRVSNRVGYGRRRAPFETYTTGSRPARCAALLSLSFPGLGQAYERPPPRGRSHSLCRSCSLLASLIADLPHPRRGLSLRCASAIRRSLSILVRRCRLALWWIVGVIGAWSSGRHGARPDIGTAPWSCCWRWSSSGPDPFGAV